MTELRLLFTARQIKELIRLSVPMGQFEQKPVEAIKERDLGLGFVYYALARVLKPDHVVVVGSYRGFTPICLGLGLEHNRKGEVSFIDAAKIDDFWTNGERVRRHFRRFGLSGRVTLYQMTTAQWLRQVRRRRRRPFIGLLVIDGDHTFRGVAYDYRHLGRFVKNGGFILLHDSFAGGVGFTDWEVGEFLSTLDVDLFEAVTLELAQGLTIIKKLPAQAVPRARLQDRRRLRALARRLADGKGAGQARLLRSARAAADRIAAGAAHLDRLLETRMRFLLKGNRDLRERLRALRAENIRLRSMVGNVRSRRS